LEPSGSYRASSFAGAAAALIAFTLASPDGLIARRNVERWEQTGRLDVAYL
jgi:hypothetical protein